jgi:hypothetical protein
MKNNSIRVEIFQWWRTWRVQTARERTGHIKCLWLVLLLLHSSPQMVAKRKVAKSDRSRQRIPCIPVYEARKCTVQALETNAKYTFIDCSRNRPPRDVYEGAFATYTILATSIGLLPERLP